MSNAGKKNTLKFPGGRFRPRCLHVCVDEFVLHMLLAFMAMAKVGQQNVLLSETETKIWSPFSIKSVHATRNFQATPVFNLFIECLKREQVFFFFFFKNKTSILLNRRKINIIIRIRSN